MNTNIALQARAPRFADPLEEYANALSIKRMRQGVQMDDERLKGAELERQQAEQAMRDEQALRGLVSQNPRATPEEIVGAGGVRTGTAYLKSRADQYKANVDARKSEFDFIVNRAKRRAQIFASATDENSYRRAIEASLQEGLTTPEEAEQAINAPWSPEMANGLKQQARMQLDYAGQLEADYKSAGEQRAAEAARRQAEEHAVTLPGKKADADLKQLTATGNAPVQPADRLRIDATTATRVESERHNKAMETAAMIRARRTGRGNGGGVAGADDPLVKTVLASPQVWDSLTKNKKDQIAAALGTAGFDFGKTLTGAEIKTFAENKAAVKSLQDLRQVLAENEQYIGPIAGLQKLSPWSDARKAQARIDLVKQRVGKTLEGGVLRKEDEEKYKKILATLNDTPSTAVAKVDGLIETLERDMEVYADELRRNGRRVNDGAKAQSGLPGVGGVYNGEKVLKVTRIQ